LAARIGASVPGILIGEQKGVARRRPGTNNEFTEIDNVNRFSFR
jgi:hypothetical protein